MKFTYKHAQIVLTETQTRKTQLAAMNDVKLTKSNAINNRLMRDFLFRFLDEGVLNIVDESRINVGLVKKTYDVKVLEEWLQDAKGPLKGAIKKQLAVMQAEPEDKEAVG